MLCRLAVRSSSPEASQTLASQPQGFLPALTNGALLNVWDLEGVQTSHNSNGRNGAAGGDRLALGAQIAGISQLYAGESTGKNGGLDNGHSEGRELEDAVAREWLRARNASIAAQ